MGSEVIGLFLSKNPSGERQIAVKTTTWFSLWPCWKRGLRLWKPELELESWFTEMKTDFHSNAVPTLCLALNITKRSINLQFFAPTFQQWGKKCQYYLLEVPGWDEYFQKTRVRKIVPRLIFSLSFSPISSLKHMLPCTTPTCVKLCSLTWFLSSEPFCGSSSWG